MVCILCIVVRCMLCVVCVVCVVYNYKTHVDTPTTYVSFFQDTHAATLSHEKVKSWQHSVSLRNKNPEKFHAMGRHFYVLECFEVLKAHSIRFEQCQYVVHNRKRVWQHLRLGLRFFVGFLWFCFRRGRLWRCRFLG